MQPIIYLQENPLVIRSMLAADVDTIYSEYLLRDWHPDRAVYQSYFEKQGQGILTVIAAEYDGALAGYTTLQPAAIHGPFVGEPIIVDFNVFIPYRNRGIGGKILDVAEELAKALSDRVVLGVGLHSGYGAAQRIYVKRGYIPDGSGVWYQDAPLAQYADCKNDDDLVLYLSKTLK